MCACRLEFIRILITWFQDQFRATPLPFLSGVNLTLAQLCVQWLPSGIETYKCGLPLQYYSRYLKITKIIISHVDQRLHLNTFTNQTATALQSLWKQITHVPAAGSPCILTFLSSTSRNVGRGCSSWWRYPHREWRPTNCQRLSQSRHRLAPTAWRQDRRRLTINWK